MRFHLIGLLVASIVFSSPPSLAADAEKLLPANTQAVVVVNIKQLLAAPLIKSYIPQIQEGIRDSHEVQYLKTTLGIDPLKDLDQLIIGAAGIDAGHAVVARGRFSAARFSAAAQKAAKDKRGTLKVMKAGTHTVYEAWHPEQEKPMYLGLADSKTLVASLAKADVVNALDIHTGKKKPALNKDLTALLKKTNPKHTISVAALGKSLSGGIPLGDKVDNINGGITIGEDIQADFVVTTRDSGTAIRIVEEFNRGMKEAKQFATAFADDDEETAAVNEMINLVKVTTQGHMVSIKARITGEMLKKIIAD
jgi:hypothetical protein